MKKSKVSGITGGQDPIAVLDLGTSKIACFIAKFLPNGGVSILGIGHQLSEGVRAGNITDMKAAEKAICAAVSAAEKMAGINVDKVVVNLSGLAVQSALKKVSTSLAAEEVSSRHFYELLLQGYEEDHHSQRQVIHSLPLEYQLDHTKGIQNPEGMYGQTLEATMHVMSVEHNAVLNVVQCLAKCHLDVEAFVSGAYASGLACLSDDDKKLGTLLLDMGAGQTSFAVFKNSEAVYVGCVPIGGMHITNDIALGLSTNVASAERIKTLYGNVINSTRDEQEMLDVPQISENGESETVHIQRATLVGIIQPRVDELFEMINQTLKEAGFGRIGGRLVMTGGASQLAGIKQFASHMLGKRAVMGVPHRIDGMAESTSGPAFSVCAGMLDCMVAMRKKEAQGLVLSRRRSLRLTFIRFGQWLKENF